MGTCFSLVVLRAAGDACDALIVAASFDLASERLTTVVTCSWVFLRAALHGRQPAISLAEARVVSEQPGIRTRVLAELRSLIGLGGAWGGHRAARWQQVSRRVAKTPIEGYHLLRDRGLSEEEVAQSPHRRGGAFCAPGVA